MFSIIITAHCFAVNILHVNWTPSKGIYLYTPSLTLGQVHRKSHEHNVYMAKRSACASSEQ